MKFVAEITLEKVSGADQDDEVLIDWFCGTIGKQNASRRPLVLEISNGEGETISKYIVELVDVPR
jgi:hypothetical protein